MSQATTRLTILLACATLATTRFGLVVHEVVGHGGTAIALGGEITAIKLFWFAGGWVGYRLDDAGLAAHLACRLGGIASELVTGAALWLALRRRTGLGARVVRGIAAGLAVHATWYLAAGTWYGFGDGIALYQELGDGRYAVSIPAALVGSLAGFASAREVFAGIAGAAPGKRWIVALVIALVANVVPIACEVYLRHDEVYTAMMMSERARTIQRELGRYQAERPDAPRAELDAELGRLEDEHPHPFPFAPVFAPITLAAIVAGCFASLRRAGPREPVSSRLAARAAITAGAGLALVIAIQLVFGT
ncbi:MAG TPA: hypothetical protein VMJ10_08040 [Kofleriaceae bacterium]|nr:hypothetical protein [Kofleriaceae bacterium]